VFLGIDGGQSSTMALIAREDGRVIGAGRSGPCNHISTDEAAAKFSRVVADCVDQACRSASLDPADVSFTSVCCGMSGGPGDKETLIRNLLRTEYLSVVTDGEIALTGALSGKPGIIVIAGTGSICYGRNAAGKLVRAGGWGYIFGDEGSAFDIVRQALRAALRFEEGWGPATELHATLLEACREGTANAVLHQFYSEVWPRSRVAQLAGLVDSAAERGDAVARAILEQAGQSLSTLAACVREQLFESEDDVRISFAGGVFRSRFVRQRFQSLIELSGLECVAPDHNPAGGALLEAFQLAGLKVTLSGIPEMK